MQKYADDYNGLYPTPSKWCDLLVENTYVEKAKFSCEEADLELLTTDTPIDETKIAAKVLSVDDYNDSTGQKKYIYEIEWSHYGLNPNAKPKSSPDVVLLFETEHGWNQFGGPELVSVKNHLEIYGKEGCNILFNDGRVKFVKPKQIDKLKWK